MKNVLKITFLFHFLRLQRRLKRQGKMVGQAIFPGNFKKRYKRSPYDSGVLFYWLTVLTWILFNQPVMSQREVVYRRFFKFWLILPNQNYQSRSKEYNFNWCWHRTLPVKKKRFSIFENLLKTSGTTTKVHSCLKTSLTIMRVDRQCDLSLKRRIIITCNISSNEVIYFI